MMEFGEFIAQDCRLVILRTLYDQTNRSLNEVLLTRALEAFGHNKSRDFVRTQLRALDELGAVKIAEAGTVMVATLLRPGIDHVERRAILEGVARPSPES